MLKIWCARCARCAKYFTNYCPFQLDLVGWWSFFMKNSIFQKLLLLKKYI